MSKLTIKYSKRITLRLLTALTANLDKECPETQTVIDAMATSGHFRNRAVMLQALADSMTDGNLSDLLVFEWKDLPLLLATGHDCDFWLKALELALIGDRNYVGTMRRN